MVTRGAERLGCQESETPCVGVLNLFSTLQGHLKNHFPLSLTFSESNTSLRQEVRNALPTIPSSVWENCSAGEQTLQEMVPALVRIGTPAQRHIEGLFMKK